MQMFFSRTKSVPPLIHGSTCPLIVTVSPMLKQIVLVCAAAVGLSASFLAAICGLLCRVRLMLGDDAGFG
jgi:hypothetical protein